MVGKKLYLMIEEAEEGAVVRLEGHASLGLMKRLIADLEGLKLKLLKEIETKEEGIKEIIKPGDDKDD